MVPRSLLILLAASACTVDVPLEGKSCTPEGGCLDGLVCDPVDNTCRTSASPTSVDWSPAMFALYPFEPNALGADASGNGRDLTPTGSVGSAEGMQGQGAAQFERDGPRFESADPAFAFSDSFTVGAWFNGTDPDHSSPNIVARRSTGAATPQGYFMERLLPEAQGTCQMERESGNPIGDTSASGTFPVSEWHHIACTFDRQAGRVETVVDGGTNGDSGFPLWTADLAPVPLLIPESADAFIDEVFFFQGVLSQGSIRRIHACGVDGRRCACDPDAPASYRNCGRAEDCGSLPPCDQASP